jgi:hypothetical protein
MAEFIEKLAFWRSDPMQDLAEDLRRARGDADALALLPYDDGTFFIKPCNFDKNLIGGQGGYETVDGDKIVLDGDGEPVKSLLGVDILLALDPTEHAGAVAPIKSAIAQKHNIGEWVKADREGNIIEVGEALVQADGGEQEVITERAVDIIAQADGFDEDSARDLVARADGYAADGGVAVGLEGSMVEKKAKREQIPMEQALAELEADGEVTKIYDLAPAAAPVIDDEGNLSVEGATHIAVDQSKAADLMPTTTSTTELNTALDKARMEEHDPGIRTKYLVYGVILGTIITVVVGGLFVGLTAVI